MKRFLFLLWLCPLGHASASPPLNPLQIAKRFVARGGWSPLKNYLCCEAATQAKHQTLGQQIPAQMRRTCQLVQQGDTTAVVAVELSEPTARSDFYLHFSKRVDGWKLRAVRNLAMTHLGPPMVAILAAMSPDEVAQYDLKHPEANHAFTVGNLKLWTSTDADIAAHFLHYRPDFEEIVRLVQEGQYFSLIPTENSVAVAGEQAANADPSIHTLLRKLYLARITRRTTGCSSCLEFVIGGKVNSTVGLLYQPQPAQLPPMHPDHLIVLKPLGNGWYLYKTI